MVLESLPGWELVMFFVLFVGFLLAGGITATIILSKLRWPFSYVILEDNDGKGNYTISRRGRMRLVSLGDGGEEVFLLKHLNKYRVAHGKRIGPKQVGWAIGEDGFWYSFTFGDLNKTLLELGLRPSSKDVRLSMSAMRKNLDNRLGDKSWLDKYGPVLYFGMFVMVLLIFAGIVYYTSNKQVEVAQVNAQLQNSTFDLQLKTQESIQKTLGEIDNVLSRIGSATNNQVVGGSGLASDG